MATSDPTNQDNATAVHTYDWDTAFAIPVAEVNKAIVDHHSSPAGFAYAESAFKVSADFGDWQVTMGGGGKNVRLALPLQKIQLVYTATDKTLSFESGTAVIEVQLHYIPHTTPAADKAEGHPYALVVKAQSDDPTEPVVSLAELTLSPTPGTVSRAVIGQSLLNWANVNLGEFAHVFAVVNLNRMVNQGQWGQTTPATPIWMARPLTTAPSPSCA